ncbi:MAG: hypothetical protein CMK44_00065 [Porticoccus sp.]|nr:hypothetical protein [Porticoccus sp.]
MNDINLSKFNQFKRYKNQNKSIALIIPGKKILSKNFGSKINEYDVSIRLNTGPTDGFEKNVGNKTSLRILNYPCFMRINNFKVRRQNFELDEFFKFNRDKNNAVFLDKYVEKKKELIQSCMRKDANYQFLFVNHLIKIFDFCLLTNFLPKFLYLFLVDYILLKRKFSLGFLVINLLIKENLNFTVFGLDLEEDMHNRTHYYKNHKPSNDHNLSLERKVLKKLYNKKKFKIYS